MIGNRADYLAPGLARLRHPGIRVRPKSAGLPALPIVIRNSGRDQSGDAHPMLSRGKR